MVAKNVTLGFLRITLHVIRIYQASRGLSAIAELLYSLYYTCVVRVMSMQMTRRKDRAQHKRSCSRHGLFAYNMGFILSLAGHYS